MHITGSSQTSSHSGNSNNAAQEQEARQLVWGGLKWGIAKDKTADV